MVVKSALRAAVVGVGAMGRHHARLYAEMHDVELVGVADTDRVARRRIAAKYGTRAFADYRELLEVGQPHFASVAVPTTLHCPIARHLLEHGIHVLLEKPIAPSVGEGAALLEIAREKKVQLGVGHIERFNPAVQALKEQLDQGWLGEVYLISVRRIGAFPPRVRDAGVSLDLATHDLDVMLCLTGARVVRVSAEVTAALSNAHEDLLCGLLRFDSGVVGMLDVNWLSPTKIRELAVHGQRGMFVVDYLTQDMFSYEHEHRAGSWNSLQVFRGESEGQMVRHRVARREPLQVELETFVESIRRGEPFPVSGEDALRALALANCLVLAGQRGQPIDPRTEQPWLW